MNILLLGYGKTNKFLKRHFKNDNVVVITDDDYQKLLNSNIVFDFAFCSPCYFSTLVMVPPPSTVSP